MVSACQLLDGQIAKVNTTLPGEVGGVALDLQAADGARRPVLITSVVKTDASGDPSLAWSPRPAVARSPRLVVAGRLRAP